MELSDARKRALGRRLLITRMRILVEQGFFGLLLMHMRFAIGDELDTAWVSSDAITFNPSFMDDLSDDELAFILEHEVMHAALGHLARARGRNQALFNVAADIVVNSNILRSNGMDLASITLREYGESMHLTPRGDEGFRYTAEEVYEMLVEDATKESLASDDSQGPNDPVGSGDAEQANGSSSPGTYISLDDLRKQGRGDRWDWHIVSADAASEEKRDEWIARLRDARDAMRSRDPENERGLVPLCAERLLDELDSPRADWRALLDEFVQEEVYDWSFQAPDRRMYESPFLMPGFTDTDAVIHNVLFMVDTSGSVSNRELTEAYAELCGALEQFAGKMDGWVGFFDAIAYEPTRFESVEDLASIRPVGGGGTRFEAVFEAIRTFLGYEDISCVVIMTDGLAPFPPESAALGIPVLWLLTKEGVTPPWGRIAHMNA